MTTFTVGNPNGMWSLYVIDDTPLNAGIISNGWYLTLTTASPVPAAADVGVTVAASAASVIVTSNVTFTVTVANYGPGLATNVVVTNTLPAGASFSASASVGTISTNAAGQLVWSLGTMLKGAQASLPVTVWPAVAGSAVFSAAASTDSTDLNPGDAQGSASVVVLAPSADLALGLASMPNMAPLGNTYALLATITNLGPATATGVTLSVLLDPTVNLVSSSPAAGPPVNGILTFTNLGDLGSNGLISVTVVVQPTAAGVNSTFATCSSDVTDPAKANNDNSAKTVVVGALQVQVQASGSNLVLSWPASLGVYRQQFTTNLTPPVTWVTLTNIPTLVGANYTYTNPIGSGPGFFRLIGSTP